MRICDKCGKIESTEEAIFFRRGKLDLCVQCHNESDKVIEKWVTEGKDSKKWNFAIIAI